MTDFPTGNSNPESFWLLGLLRLYGLEPAGDGILLDVARLAEAAVLGAPPLQMPQFQVDLFEQQRQWLPLDGGGEEAAKTTMELEGRVKVVAGAGARVRLELVG